MTGLGVERTPRTAHRPSPVPPAGVSALMPPPSQGAERRRERHAARTGSRWGLRALVIGGMAGAAWLLTGAAAHAADLDPAAEGSLLGSSPVGSVLHGYAARPVVVTRVPQAAAQPLEPNHHAHEQHKFKVSLAGLGQAPTAIVADSTLGGATRLVRDLTAPIRLTGGPSDSQQIAPISISGVAFGFPPRVGSAPAPVTKALRPAIDLVPSAAVSKPAAQHRHHQATPVAVGSTATHEMPSKAAIVAVVAPGSQIGDRATAHPAGTTVSQWRSGVADRHHAAVEADRPETVWPVPTGKGPAPLQVHLGAVSGTPAHLSGAPTEGGSAPILPAAIGEQAVASHRLPLAADAEARHHDAEAPTVSPD